MNKLLTLEHITAAYDTKVVLRDVGLTVWETDFLGIIGPNGGGKTTLLKVILRLLKPVAGTVAFYRDGQPVASLNIGYLPQINKIDKRFPISVREVIASGLMAQTRGARHLSKQQQQRVAEVIVWMGLDALSRRAIGELSGGELQRVMLGRAIVSRPQMLILDEPNTYVDQKFDLLREINQDTAVVLVSHDVGTVLSLVKNVACVNESLHYHPGADVSEEWMDEVYRCPIELVGHGELPHRILKRHD